MIEIWVWNISGLHKLYEIRGAAEASGRIRQNPRVETRRREQQPRPVPRALPLPHLLEDRPELPFLQCLARHHRVCISVWMRNGATWLADPLAHGAGSMQALPAVAHRWLLVAGKQASPPPCRGENLKLSIFVRPVHNQASCGEHAAMNQRVKF